MKLVESLLLFGSLALLIMFADQFVYKKVSFAESSFFLMFGLAGFMYYLYRRGTRKMKEETENKAKQNEKPKKIADRLKRK